MRSVRILLLAAMFAVLVFALGGCGGGGSDTQLPGDQTQLNPEDLVPDVTVQVVDHRFRKADLSSDNLDPDPIFTLISSASASLDVALPLINRQAVVQALLTEAKSGTRIRIITEKAYYDDPAYKPFYDQLENPALNGGNLEIHTDKEGLPRLMHARFMVIDQARVVTGSYNWESDSADRSFGDVITILNTNVAAAFTSQFNQMFVEGNFGVHKRNATQHSFRVGGGNGMLEVYFGPTDQPADLLESEIEASSRVIFAVQQFKDFRLASFMLNYLAANPNSTVVAMINDAWENADAEESAVARAFINYTQVEDQTGGTLLVNAPIDSVGRSGRDQTMWPRTSNGMSFGDYNTMNHKLMFCDHALDGGLPTVIFSTANYSNIGFTQNDEIFLFMRGAPLVNKYLRGTSLENTLPPDTLRNAGDMQEFNQLIAMWPFIPSSQAAGGVGLRDFIDVSSAIIFGEVTNFTPEVTVQDDDGNLSKIPIDLQFSIRGRTFFDNFQFGGDPDVAAEEDRLIFPRVLEGGDMFVQSELLNPKHRYMMVVPAGEITVTTIVIEGTEPSTRFSPNDKTFFVGPGAVRKINLQINPATSNGNTNAGGGGI